jgi:putative addiction module component (TIGR02574 family)
LTNLQRPAEDKRVVPTLQQLGIEKLSVVERLELIGATWESILDIDPNQPAPESHLRVLEQRLAAAEADPGGGTPWEVVKARLGASDEFWRLIAERRRQGALSRAELEQNISRPDGTD